eukprot:2996270-Alexandrium_andersonii.AAC.1
MLDCLPILPAQGGLRCDRLLDLGDLLLEVPLHVLVAQVDRSLEEVLELAQLVLVHGGAAA